MRYRNRRAATIENDRLRLTVLESGGHIAEVFDKETGVNPLWTPDWPSIDPAAYDRSRHPEYGGGVDAALLAGIMGHNLCLDIFGGPSPEEAAAGLPVHGEASTARFEIDRANTSIVMRAMLPLANLQVERELELVDLPGAGAESPRERAEPVGDRSAGRLDRARHPRPAVPSEGRHRVPCVGVAIESLRGRVRPCRLPEGRRRVRLARRAGCRRRDDRSPRLPRCASLERVHGAPHEPGE